MIESIRAMHRRIHEATGKKVIEIRLGSRIYDYVYRQCHEAAMTRWNDFPKTRFLPLVIDWIPVRLDSSANASDVSFVSE